MLVRVRIFHHAFVTADEKLLRHAVLTMCLGKLRVLVKTVKVKGGEGSMLDFGKEKWGLTSSRRCSCLCAICRANTLVKMSISASIWPLKVSEMFDHEFKYQIISPPFSMNVPVCLYLQLSCFA